MPTLFLDFWELKFRTARSEISAKVASLVACRGALPILPNVVVKFHEILVSTEEGRHVKEVFGEIVFL